MARFEKGQSGNPNGRKAGTPNRLTNDLRDVLQAVLSKELTAAKLSAMLKGLEPNQRLNALIKLLEFSIPRLQSVSIEAQINAEFEALEKLLNSAPETALDLIYERIKRLKEHGTGTEN